MLTNLAVLPTFGAITPLTKVGISEFTWQNYQLVARATNLKETTIVKKNL
jgi:hypothetical protein